MVQTIERHKIISRLPFQEIMAFFYKVTHTCIRFFGEYKHLFVMFLAINFIVWLKVATDIFLVFALFLMLEFSNKVCIKNTLYESKL